MIYQDALEWIVVLLSICYILKEIFDSRSICSSGIKLQRNHGSKTTKVIQALTTKVIEIPSKECFLIFFRAFGLSAWYIN